ncbi:hypothetical protein TPHA_0A01450 [Tetrapisispora phaffii CBS 4417]|uniref:Pre-mRNA-splicing factor CWC15 n=1 Tax=Tetrapisispora phaffii (strain ATCC 24235 / CBS 4417 / NBRC 1672 / NRRL Y-8282 / UCD 70-5) TaxID=1071381 RepID=G8BMV0_TETPH|nr:hypothetical protein TPHA_0A01450 [Tetrapisispora phaffii CBS 4417]CCE61228.1 hypothetical protein TPHA_0A01450 [Tetrapisispora phaffii CBS 4417]
MTTSHRPQLEARSGAKSAAYVPTSIQHASLLPGHLDIKYRNTKPFDKELRKSDTKESRDQFELENTERGDQEKVLKEVDISENELGSSEDDLDDEETLENELRALKKDKVKGDDTSDTAKTSIDLKDKNNDSDTKTPKKSWRNSTTFNRNKGKVKKSQHDQSASSKYVNDLTKSDYHQEFLKKFIK